MQRTGIAWAEYSSNPIYAVNAEGQRGWYCTKVSQGCRHCYAEALNMRYGNGHAFTPHGAAGIDWRLNEAEFAAWGRLKRPSRIFVCDMTDWCHPDIPIAYIRRMWRAFAEHGQHTYMLLTKRPEQLRVLGPDGIQWYARHANDVLCPQPNVWLGVSVENQRWANERIPLLLETPAAVRFVSAEPLLSAIDIRQYAPALSWIICGGESGRGFRPMELDWARSLQRQCADAGVPFFFKQASALRPGQPSGDAALDAAKALP